MTSSTLIFIWNTTKRTKRCQSTFAITGTAPFCTTDNEIPYRFPFLYKSSCTMHIDIVFYPSLGLKILLYKQFLSKRGQQQGSGICICKEPCFIIHKKYFGLKPAFALPIWQLTISISLSNPLPFNHKNIQPFFSDNIFLVTMNMHCTNVYILFIQF